MRIVGVIDVREGRAVHARGGERGSYVPVATAAGTSVDGHAEALARAYVEVLGVRELYLADLDAIAGGIGALNSAIVERIAALGVPLWVDAGVSTVSAAATVIDAGASTVIVGLETLARFEALSDACAAIDGQRVAFSVDLRNGLPIVSAGAAHATWSTVSIAARAAASGVANIIVLDLARVGTGVGIDLGLLTAVRQAVPNVALFAGGGVRGSADLDRLALAGCDGALVATALLNGSIRPSTS